MSRRKPTLSDLDVDNFDDYEATGRWDKGRGAVRIILTPPVNTIGSPEHCWCGQPRSHDWPGRSEGKPHPNAS